MPTLFNVLVFLASVGTCLVLLRLPRKWRVAAWWAAMPVVGVPVTVNVCRNGLAAEGAKYAQYFADFLPVWLHWTVPVLGTMTLFWWALELYRPEPKPSKPQVLLYKMLDEGELVEPTDEVLNDATDKWEPVQVAGCRVSSPEHPSHRAYRRLLTRGEELEGSRK